MEDDTYATSRVPPPHEVIIVPPPGHEHRTALLEQCIQLRINVFVTEQGFPLEVEVDEHVITWFQLTISDKKNRHDPTATHWLLRLVPSLEPVGTIRAHKVVQVTNPYYKLTRLAVLGEYRHHKFGGKLMLALHDWVKDDARRSGMIDFVKVVCHSQAVRSDSAGAVAFYRKYDVIIMFPEDSIWTHRCFSSLRFGYEEEVTMIPV